MTRNLEILQAAQMCARNYGGENLVELAFKKGAEWADAHQPSPWISVEDRLPEEKLNKGGYGLGFSERVLVRFERVYDHGQKDIDHDTSNYMNVTKTWLNHNKHYIYYTDRITHWMPIPELKGGEE